MYAWSTQVILQEQMYRQFKGSNSLLCLHWTFSAWVVKIHQLCLSPNLASLWQIFLINKGKMCETGELECTTLLQYVSLNCIQTVFWMKKDTAAIDPDQVNSKKKPHLSHLQLVSYRHPLLLYLENLLNTKPYSYFLHCYYNFSITNS